MGCKDYGSAARGDYSTRAQVPLETLRAAAAAPAAPCDQFLWRPDGLNVPPHEPATSPVAQPSDLLEARGRDLDDRQPALSRSKFDDGFGLDGLDGRLNRPDDDPRSAIVVGAVAASVEEVDKPMPEVSQVIS